MKFQNKWFLLICILILIFIKNSYIFIIITSYVPIQTEFLLTKTDLGLFTTMYYLASLLGSINWTVLYGKWSKFKLLSVGGLSWIIGITFMTFNTSYIQIILASIISGFGAEALTIIAINTYSALISTNKRGKAFSLFILVQGMGGLFGVFITGLLEGIYQITWRNLIGGIGLISMIILGFILFYFHKLKIDTIDQKIGEISNPVKDKAPELVSETLFFPMDQKVSKDLIRDTFANKINILIFILFLIFFPIHDFNNVWIQKYWIEIHGLSQSMASISLIFTSGGEFLGIITGGFLIDKLGQKKESNKPKIGTFGLIISIPFFIIGYTIAWSMNPTAIQGMNFIEICWYMFTTAIGNQDILVSYSTLFFAFFSSQLIAPLFYTILLGANKNRTRSLALNIGIVLYNLGLLIGPTLGGYIGDLFNLQVTLLFIPGIYAISAILFYIIARAEQKSISQRIT